LIAQQQGDAALQRAAEDAAHYTPVASSVRLLHSRLSSNALLLASLSRLQALVPAAVAAQAVSAAGQAQALTVTYGAPLVARVDDKINSAITTVRDLPSNTLSYGSAKVAAADSLAYNLTPEALKPAYKSSRALVTDAAAKTVERVQSVKAQRGQQLWSKLEQVQAQVASLRAALEKSGAQASQALDLHKRVADLQAKVNSALSLAQEKRAQARHLSQEVLQSVSELTHQLTSYLESSVLTPSQVELVRSLWARVVDRVNSLKAQLHLGSNGSSPASSRSESNASLSGADEPEAAKAASASSDESDSKVALPSSSAAAAAGTDTNGVHKRQPHSKRAGSKKGGKQQQDEQKAGEHKAADIDE